MTVSIPVKYASYMTPVLRASPIDDLDDDSDDVDDNDSADFSANSDRDSDIFGMNFVSPILIPIHSTKVFKSLSTHMNHPPCKMYQ